MKKIKINDITIRDIFQSLNPKYINTKILDTILSNLDKLNFESLEIWGGASFEKILGADINKTPWEMLSYIKDKVPSTPLQALIGAKNLVGLEIYSKNIIEKFIKNSIKNGIDIFRVYDPLNDLDNLKYTISTISENNAKCQGTIIYDELKNISFYEEMVVSLEQSGCSSICIKDAESTLLPQKTSELFKTLKQSVNVPLYLSVYNLKGLQTLNYFEACTSGCDGVDLSFIPSSYGSYNPFVFSFILSLKDTNLSHNLNYQKVLELYKYIREHIYPHIDQKLYSEITLSNINRNLLPKWLITSINNQLEEIGEAEKLDLVLEEIFKIKKEVGSPSLATPIGQIIGSQAILNTIISDYRWEIICDEMKKLLWGYYGKLPHDIDENLMDKISDQIEPSKKPISKDTEDIYKQCQTELKNLSEKEEDILSYCFFPEKTRKFLENRRYTEEKPLVSKGVDFTNMTQTAIKEVQSKKIPFDAKEGKKLAPILEQLDIKKLREITNLVESSNIDEIKLEIEGIKISINKSKLEPYISRQEKMDKPIKEGEILDKSKEEPAKGQISENIVEIKSPIVGVFYRAPSPGAPPFVNIGDKVEKGDTLCIIEAMKLMNKITSDYSGEVKEILVKNEEPVEFNQTIMLLKVNENNKKTICLKEY